jgi:flavin-dependent thymidylate synthase
MQIRLAGYNIDKKLIDKLGKDISATPEVISAAYARISRSSKSVTELRGIAAADVEKARNSNWEIVFEMGHASVAEHAVFNFDIIGISRYLAEFIQRSRLASFTEKSQRYVTLDGDYVLPAEIEQSRYNNEFNNLMDKAFSLYSRLFEELKLQKATEQEWSSKRELEGAAKEDARYVLPLCTRTQMGMTINARSLELLLRRLAALPLQEAQELYQLLYKEVSSVAPSIVRFVDTDEFLSKKLPMSLKPQVHTAVINEVTLVDFTYHADAQALAGLLFEQQGGSFSDLLKSVKAMTKKELQALWQEFFQGIKPWHKMPRAFELVDFTFELTMSASCYAQFKRHRLCTILKAPYNARDGFVIPPAITRPAQIKEIKSLLSEAESLAQKVSRQNPILYPYLLTNAHRVRVLAKMNLRELYHFTRLRSDSHAQWEIRNLSDALIPIVQKRCPFSAQWLMGKSEFPS